MVGTRPAKTRPDATVGRLLAEARRRRGQSLVTVAHELSIPQHHLEALEAGDVSVFPAEVYARGAFTKYATYLGLQSSGNQRAFQRLLTGAREYVPLRLPRPRSWLAAKFTPRLVLAAAIASAALAVGGYIGWQVTSFVRLPALSIDEPAGSVADVKTITVGGTAAQDATVVVNGEQVLLSDDGQFSADLRLHQGINIVRVEATNAAGRTRVLQRDILLPSS